MIAALCSLPLTGHKTEYRGSRNSGTDPEVSHTSDFGSGDDVMLREFEPHIGLSAVSTEPAGDSLSVPSLLSLSLSQE